MKNFGLIICLIINISCSGGRSKELRIASKKNLEVNELKETKIVNDAFINELTNALDYENLIKEKHTISFKSVDNPIYPEKKDTIIDLDIKNCHLNYYKAFGKIMITDAKIKGSDIELCSDKIHIGTSKEIFINKFRVHSIHDKLVISDTEERITCEFMFSNEFLIEIIYSAFID